MNELTESTRHNFAKKDNCWLDQIATLNTYWRFPLLDHPSFAIIGIMGCTTIDTCGRSEMAMAFH
jgi:hypothetical protein